MDTLEDRTWSEVLEDQRPRGRKSKFPHWSKASLCFDLEKFGEEYSKAGKNLLAIDFRNVLTWAITDLQSGQSAFPKPQNYENPLPLMHDAQHQGHFIRLSRLWSAAAPNPGLKEAHFKNQVRPMLEQHGTSPEMIEKVISPLGELMTTLRDVKLSDVTFLELQPFDPNVLTVDSYNDAIVSIFTRLNTAGRTLEREEIILAWLKVGWNAEKTSGKSAGTCFIELQNALSECDLEIKLDPLVSAISLLWSVSNYEGKLLENSDLLKGSVIRPMATALSERWDSVREAVTKGNKALFDRNIEYGSTGRFSSVYALAVFWAWLYVSEIWKSNHPLGVLQRDDFDKRCGHSVSKHIDRWILCSQWAGIWSGASNTTIQAYAKKLAELLKNMDGIEDVSLAHEMWDECFKGFIDGVVQKALEYIGTLAAPSRERVSVYQTALWVWHRLDSDRWEKSQVQLRVGRRKPSCDVDHIVSYSLWEERLGAGLPNGIVDRDDAQAVVNKLGNCALLEKNFNISKSKGSLKSFLLKIHEVIKKKIRVDAWCAALGIANPMLEPDHVTVDEIYQAINTRDEEIREELSDFVRGRVARKDVESPTVVESANLETFTPQAGTAGNLSGGELESINSQAANLVDELAEVEQTPETEAELVMHQGFDSAGIRLAYAEDSEVKLVIDHFGQRERNQHVTPVDTLVLALQRARTPLPRPTVVRVLRSLDALGIGRFIPGRKGRQTRFEWHSKSLFVRSKAFEGTDANHQEELAAAVGKGLA